MDGLRAVTLLALALPNAGAFSAFATSVSRPLPLASHPQTCGHAPRAIAPLERRAAAAAVCMASSAAEEEKLPPAVRAITLTVLAQMIGEGIALTSLPLHMKTLGASTVMSGVAVSGFSLSSLIFTPLVVSLSEQTGRFRMLRVCLFGCALAQLIIVQATKPVGVVVGRFLCGIFAASVPVAQAAVTDLVTSSQSALALSRVSAVSQAGVVVGPAIGAVAISILNGLGVPDVRGLHMRCVFASSATFALAVLAGQIALGVVAKSPGDESADSDTDGSISTSGRRRSDALPLSSKATEAVEKLPLAANVRTGDMLAQWALRFVAISLGWGLTLSMATYSLFGSMIVGYTQQQLSINFSAAAALAVTTQLVFFPRMVKKLGEHLVCALGLTFSAAGLLASSVIKLNPMHSVVYLLNRMGNALGDTACATLVARASDGSEARARNLGAIYSVRAGARIVTPLLSAWLFEISRLNAGMPGALPYFIVSALTVALIPVPLALKSFEKKGDSSGFRWPPHRSEP